MSDDTSKGIGAVLLLVLGLCFLIGTCTSGNAPSPQREEQRIQREARDRIQRDNETLLKAADEARIQLEVERQRQGRR